MSHCQPEIQAEWKRRLIELMREHDDFADCPVCYGMMQWESCWHCFGEGGFHDCGEDCCCCLDPEEITDDCPECHGHGGYLQCMALPHTEEQMEAYQERLEKAK